MLLLNKLLEDGNTLFKKGKIGEAAHRYQYALRRIPLSPNHKDTFNQLKIHLLLNLSRSRRKVGDFSDALQLADSVLNLNKNCFEAHYAKAKANRESGQLHAALANLTDAARIAPQNREIHRVILKIKEEIKTVERSKLDPNEGSSTSGVDSSSGSSSHTKDFDTDTANNSLII